MRATINFEVDVGRVQETMGAVMREELHPLHQAMDLLEHANPQELHKSISDALEILYGVTTQLKQYQGMVASFEKARFETILPQSVEEPPQEVPGEVFNSLDDLRDSLNNVKAFTSFMNQAQEETDDDPEEG